MTDRLREVLPTAIAFLKELFSFWQSASWVWRVVLLAWVAVLLRVFVWVVLEFRLQLTERAQRLWLTAPASVKWCMALLILLSIPIFMKMLQMPRAQRRRTASVKAQRILDNFTQFLDQQLPQHEKEIKAITAKISARFPPTVGPQGPEYRMQVEAAYERGRKIRGHLKEARRQIEDFYLEAGLPGVSDAVITGRIEDVQRRAESTLELVRQTTRERCFRGAPPGAFEEVWSTVSPESHSDA